MKEASSQSGAHLYQLAQATALLRLYREHEGHEAPSPEAAAAWVERHPEIPRPIEPSAADYREALRRR
jgi:hypothetical protein